MKKKPVVGQILYSLNVGNAARCGEQNLTPVKVLKVGRKYFYCEQKCLSTGKYHVGTWEECHDTCVNSKLYETAKEWEDEKEGRMLAGQIGDCFEYKRNTYNLSLKTLHALWELISVELKNNKD